jgi:hypothetical protein
MQQTIFHQLKLFGREHAKPPQKIFWRKGLDTLNQKSSLGEKTCRH